MVTKRAIKRKAGPRGAKRRERKGGQPKDALAVLRADHDAVTELVEKYERGKSRMDADKKERLGRAICEGLKIHAQIEEEIFYPAIREHSEAAEDVLAEAEVEHGTVKELIAKLESASPDNELYDATVKVIGEYVKHHVKEEYSAIFPLARNSDLNLKELGRQLMERKAELKGAEDKPEAEEREGEDVREKVEQEA